MCLAVPMKLLDVARNGIGVAELDGVSHTVDLSLVDEPAIGDYVVVHAGFAIEKLDSTEAEARIRLFGELAEDMNS